jgi:hypothetical protein
MKRPGNTSGLKSLDVLERHAAVLEVYRDEDGIWLAVLPHFTCDPDSAHDGHEWNVRDILRVARGIKPCECALCAADCAWTRQR